MKHLLLALVLLAGCAVAEPPPTGCSGRCWENGAHLAWWCAGCKATVTGHFCVTCRAEFRLSGSACGTACLRGDLHEAWTCGTCRVRVRGHWCFRCGDEWKDDGRYAVWTCSKCGRKNATYRCPACDP